MGRPRAQPKTKKVKDPNKPKRATSAYFYFLADCREEAKRQKRSLSKIAEFTKECSKKWAVLDGKGKKKFDDQAAADKKRYANEMANYTGVKGKAAKDPNKPKRPMSGYFLFLGDFRKEHKGSDLPNKELLKEAGEEWRNMDDEEKKPYEKQAQVEQKKYEAQMVKYREEAANGASAEEEEEEEEEEEDEEEDEEDDE